LGISPTILLFLSAALREIVFLSNDGTKRSPHSTFDVQKKLLLIEYLAEPLRVARAKPEA
jgi:hypothetical protein